MMGGSGTKAPNCGCTSQVSRALGNDLRNTATDGSVCIISPSELILMMSIFLYSIQVPKNVIIENSIAVILHKPRQAPFFQSSASFRFHTIFCIKANKLPPVYRKPFTPAASAASTSRGLSPAKNALQVHQNRSAPAVSCPVSAYGSHNLHHTV